MRNGLRQLAAHMFPTITVVEDDSTTTDVTPEQTVNLVESETGWGVPDYDDVPASWADAFTNTPTSLEGMEAWANEVETGTIDPYENFFSDPEGSVMSLDADADVEDFFAAIGAAMELNVPYVQYWHPEVLVQHGASTEESRITVAYLPFENELAFAIAYCSPSDQFNRRRGRELATDRLYSGEAVTIPTRGLLTNGQCRQLIESFVDLGHLTGPPNFPENQQLTVLS